MIHRLTRHLRGNAVAYVALFIALGGTSYAATSLPRGSVGSRQLQKGAVTPAKLAPKSFGGRILAVTELQNNGAVLKSNPTNVHTTNWVPYQGGYVVYPYRIPSDCFPVATPTQTMLSESSALPQIGAGMEGLTTVQISENGATQLTLAIVCLH